MLSKMPSRKTKTPVHTSAKSKAKSSSRPKKAPNIVFFPLLILVFIMWMVYRSTFHFPVWFDETIGKAIFFGFPVMLYVSLTRSQYVRETYAPNKLYRGLLLGVAVGGIYGFAASIATLASRHAVVAAAPLFLSNAFWWQFFLGVMTAFWETLFFYSWVMAVIQEKFRKWSMAHQIALTCLIFVIFHLPNTILRAPSLQLIVSQIILLGFFAVGQALLFQRTRNFYALTLSQALWGMVLLVSSR